MKELFAFANKRSPENAVLFLDELDCIVCNRKDRRDRVDDGIFQSFLLCMNDLETKMPNLFVFAATNRPDQLDRATGQFLSEYYFFVIFVNLSHL